MPESSKTQPAEAAYRQIEESLRTRIRQGHWPLGTMLPGRRELAREYGVSPITVERAVTHLLADGTLRSDNRRGTFVALVAPEPTDAQPQETSASTGMETTRRVGEIVHNTGEAASAVVRRRPVKTPLRTLPLTVGVIASLYLFDCDHLQLNNALVRTLLEAMETALAEETMETRLYNRVTAPGQPLCSLEQSLHSALEEGVDALVVIALGLDPAVVDAGLSVLGAPSLPLVCITSSELRRPTPHVFYDNHSAGYQAAQHLLERGHRQFLVLAPFTASWVGERIAGIRSAVEHAGLGSETVLVYPEASPAWVNEEDPEVLGYEAGRSAFSGGLVPSGVICVNDGTAFGFLQAASEAGKVVGPEVSVVGFDNHPRSLGLGLTSLRAPMEEMGREAARFLLREVHGEGTGFQMRLRWRLIPRASTRITS